METILETWQQDAERHVQRLQPFADRYLQRQMVGDKHPVEDFIWQYFNIRPARLLQWSPGVGRVCTGSAASIFEGRRGFSRKDAGWWIAPEDFPEARVKSAKWIGGLLRQTAGRAGIFGCMGLHEWAMVYNREDVRHPQLPLRLSHEATREVVETYPVRCTHYDAFRFFSRDARPLNRLELTADGRPEQEQPACLHANMDLLKWHLKLSPWLSSNGIADLFALAMEARIVDMRASPYDVREMGLEPICIETDLGRKAYVEEQRRIADSAAPLRDGLLVEIDELVKRSTAKGETLESV